MKNKNSFMFLVTILFVLIVQAYQNKDVLEKFEKLNSHYFSFQTSQNSKLLDEDECKDPTNFIISEVTDKQATIIWDSNGMKEWEYHIQEEGIGFPPNVGAPTTKVPKLNITQDSFGSPLLGDTIYEYYIRVVCEDGTVRTWLGPFLFKTQCTPILVYPFQETFNTSSPFVDCWTLINDGPSSWEKSSDSPYEGDEAMQFVSFSFTDLHDNWLISPGFSVDSSSIYELSFYYKTNSYSGGSFELLLSKTGIEKVDFSTIISPEKVYMTDNYVKVVHHLTGHNGIINLAWHIKNEGTNSLYLDLITLEKVDCISPDINDIKISDVTDLDAQVTWKDDNNKQWDYFVKIANGIAPTAGGTNTTSTDVTITKLNAGGILQPNTEYEFYLRSNCNGSDKGKWIGPIIFKTLCSTQITPFSEGFNDDSTTIDCWLTVTKDSFFNTSMWEKDKINYEGSHSMLYYGFSMDMVHDAWLISPSIRVTEGKYYRVSYYYRTSASAKTDFEVRLSSKGPDLANFTTILDTKTNESHNSFVRQSYIVEGNKGNINIAWRVNGLDAYQFLYIDAVLVEEVTCIDPGLLQAINIGQTNFDITWEDKLNTDWEYSIQKIGEGIPTSNGTPTKNKINTIAKDNKGNAIIENTAYEFYVRSKCISGAFSEWIGPIKLRTNCGIISLPFWEGFNKDSKFIYCWQTINNKEDQALPTWKQDIGDIFEGTHAMHINYYDSTDLAQADDWLISPTFKLDPTKIYRLKYKYKTSSENQNAFEVLASNTGSDIKNFNTEIVKNKTYNNSNYLEQISLISNYGGPVNFAWHAKGIGSIAIHIDDISLEEVTTCPEPINLTVLNVTEKQAELSWTDDYKANSWEYFIQETGKGIPTTNGIITTTKVTTATMDAMGNNLVHNTDYEFYVRTICSDGTYSDWSGPFVFTTTCDTYTTPFWEGFNSNQVSFRCWTIIDNNNDSNALTDTGRWAQSKTSSYEGDQSMYFYAFDWLKKIDSDDWLITPNIKTSSGQYVLKFHYKANTLNTTDLEILLSSNGTNISDFNQVLSPKTTYTNSTWKEQLIFFTAPSGISNIAFRVKGVGTHMFNLDNVVLKKIETCPEPYHLTITNQTSNTVDLTWQQDTGITSWEVIVVDYNADSTATPIQTQKITGTPEVKIMGLKEGTPYTFYVRALCGVGNTSSEWSTAQVGGTKVGSNNDCTGAIKIPVNTTLTCDQTISATLFGATLDPTPTVLCGGSAFRSDIWFEFTATYTAHMIKLLDFVSLNEEAMPTIVMGLYDKPCNLNTTALLCSTFFLGAENIWRLTGLTPGQKYYIRLGSGSSTAPNYAFKLCLGTPEFSAMEINPSGSKYSVEELINTVFVNSNCNLVSNIKYQVGDGSFETTNVNTLGYFNKKESSFPFEEGIVLSTGQVEYVPGPYLDGNRGDNPHRWTGDKDLNDAINDAGGNPEEDQSMRVTQLEYDFIPVKDSIQFDYLFASNSYIGSCTYTCKNGALFAAWLIDTTTGIGQNLAKIKGTQTSISLGNIWDSKKIDGTGCSINTEYFWNNYTSHTEPLEAPFNFAGSTTAMSSETVYVIPGRKYHIKLAVMDFCTNSDHTSAVFFKAGSFDLGSLDLGKDLTIENENALCDDEKRILKSGLSDDKNVVAITWFKDGIEIKGENTPDLEVKESGYYSVSGYYKEIECEIKGEIKVEIYPAIHTLINQPENVSICRFVSEVTLLDLTKIGHAMFTNQAADPLQYTLTYYHDNLQREEIIQPTQFEYEGLQEKQEIFILVEDLLTGCTELFSFYLLPTVGIIPTKPEDISVCENYTLPILAANQNYYNQPGGQGKLYKAGDILEPGQYQLYIHQNNGENCFEEVSFKIEITPAIQLFTQEDVTMECGFFELPKLPEHNRYFIELDGQSTEVYPGYIIYQDNTRVHIVAESKNKICKEQTSFIVRYADCPIPKGFSPNGDGINDTFDLSNHGVSDLKIFNRNGVEVYSFKGAYTNQWKGQSKGGKTLPSGTYYYVITAFGKTRTGWVQLNR